MFCLPCFFSTFDPSSSALINSFRFQSTFPTQLCHHHHHRFIVVVIFHLLLYAVDVGQAIRKGSSFVSFLTSYGFTFSVVVRRRTPLPPSRCITSSFSWPSHPHLKDVLYRRRHFAHSPRAIFHHFSSDGCILAFARARLGDPTAFHPPRPLPLAATGPTVRILALL